MLYFKQVTYLVCLLILVIVQPAQAKKETYFSCQNGFQFESKKDAVRCIKQQRLSYRSPLKCNLKGDFKLAVDKKGQKDLCISIASNKKAFNPICSHGYKLQVKRGKDTCAKGKPEMIKSPSQKVKR